MDKNSKQETIIETAKARFKIGMESDSKNRENAREDMRFRLGDQWPDQIKREREADSRPCLTINKIPQNVHQVVNDQRQNRPAIKVSPVDSQGDPETARIFQGIIRNIEYNSNADTAYDMAFDSAVTGGRGFFRILTDYMDHMSFDQDIKVKSIHDPHSVVLDPSYREPDGSDANWGFIADDIPKSEFKEQYPDAECLKETFNWDSQDSDWFRKDTLRVVEYYEKVMSKEKLYLLKDGSTVLESEIKESEFDITDEEIAELKFRWTMVPKIKWYKINGNQILEETDWPCNYIPIIPVHGVELWDEGERIFEGIIRHAKDPQRMYNYWATCETETIALAPKAPFIGAEGQFEGYEHDWATANIKNHPYLEYKPVSHDDRPVPPPSRNHASADTQAITNARMLSSDDLKSTTGIYDAALGNRSNETTGVAIQKRATQAQTSNFHFTDNLSRSIRHAGRIILNLIPKIYDTERVVRIIGPDEEEEVVTINKTFEDPKTGKKKKYSLDTGKYDCAVSTGPSYSTKRQEAVDSMLGLVKNYPQVAQYISDLLVKNMDWPGSDEIARRLKKLVPPEVLTEDDETQIPPEIKAQLDQQAQLIDDLTKKLNEATDEVEGKRLEIESKERIENQKIQRDYDLKSAELQAKHGAGAEIVGQLQLQMNNIQERLELLDIDSPINEKEIAQGLEAELNTQPPGGSPESLGDTPMEEF